MLITFVSFKKVAARKGVTIQANYDSEFFVYVHDRGEEYYLHYDFWPSVPYIHHVKHKEYFTDLVVEKELEVQNENCEQTLYDYFGGYFNRISFVESIFIIIYFCNRIKCFF